MGTFNIGNIPVAPIITYGGTDDILHETVNGVYKFKDLTELVIPDEITELGDYALSLYGGYRPVNSSTLTKVNFNNVKICGKYAVQNLLSYSKFENLSTLEFPNLQKCGDSCFKDTFSATSAASSKSALTEVYFPELIFADRHSFNDCFMRSSITKISFPKLETINTSCFQYAFQYCQSLVEANFPVLNSIKDYSFDTAFRQCTSLESISFPALDKINCSSCFSKAFSKCASLKSVSFPALNTSSFYSYTSQFNNMLDGVTGCTVHFPASIESTISSWTSVQSGFSGTNTVVLFDL